MSNKFGGSKWCDDNEELLLSIMGKTPYQTDGWDYEVALLTAFFPEQKPLTEQQVIDLFHEAGDDPFEFAKAIELAHGIGVEK